MAVGERYSIKKYQSDAGGIYSIRVSDDVAAAGGNTAITAAFSDKKVKVAVTGTENRRKSGIRARGFRVGLPTAVGASTYSATSFIPVFSPTVWADTEEGDTLAYQSGTWEVLTRISET